MAGHSHAANVKWRKDRQAQIRSQEHQKARKKIEILIQQEGKVSEKTLSIAREHSFSKDKVYHIWEKLKQKQTSGENHFRKLYRAPFDIIIYCEGKEEKKIQKVVSFLSEEMQWKEIVGDPSCYFRKINLLEIEIKDNSNSLEDCLLTNLPDEALSKIEKMEIKDNQVEIIFSEKEVGEEIKNLLLENSSFSIKSKKSIWQPLVFQELATQEAKLYAELLKQKIIQNQLSINFFTNISLS
jgi:hypothetical protein